MASTIKFLETDDLVLFVGGDVYTQWLKRDMIIDGITFNTCEQWMMYKKAKYFGDEEVVEQVMLSQEPKEQKKLGRIVKNYDDNEWLKVCDDIVYKGNLAKFSQNEDLKLKLLATGNKIIAEASHYDARWGTGLNIDDTLKTPIEKWGENRLGKAIMKVRETLRSCS
jgi:ribA/ribD-fused uncharacterized protein